MPMDKDQVLNTLEDEREKTDDYQDTVAVLELELLNEDTGIIRGELHVNGEKETTGSVLLPLQEPKPENWQDLEAGDKKAYGVVFNSQKETLREKLSNFFERSIDEGKMQEFVPGSPLQ